MKIFVKVKARSKLQKVECVADGSYKVWVKAVPERGKANEAVIEALSGHFDVPKRFITIVSGHASSTKTIDVPILDPVPKASKKQLKAIKGTHHFN